MMSTDDFKKIFPSQTHEEKVYNFTKDELGAVRTYDAIKTLGEMAGILIDNILNARCLGRIGIIPKKGIGVTYHKEDGTFTVYTPRFWCGLCKDEVGTEIFEGGRYCVKCLELARIKKEVEGDKNGAA